MRSDRHALPTAEDLDAVAEEERIRKSTSADPEIVSMWVGILLFLFGFWMSVLHWFVPILRKLF